MTSLIPARRRAERFDSLVEGGGRRDDVDQATSDLLEVVGALRAMPEVQPRPGFVADLRERLMEAAEEELAPVRARRRDDVERLTVRPTRNPRERRVAIAIGTVAVIGATTSMAYASQSAIPGDALYPLKRAIENTETGFSRGDDAKGQAMLGNASTRLHEVDELSQQKDPDSALVVRTLDTFTSEATDASNHLLAAHEQDGDPASIRQLHQFTQASIDQLSELASVVPQSADAALQNAAAALMDIDAAATHVCPDCGTGLTELPPTLVADAAHAAEGLTGLEAGGALDGTGPSSGPTASAQQNAGKGTRGPSGLNPPDNPIQIPTPQPSDATHALGNLLPTPGSGQGSSGSGGSGSGSNGGKHHHPPVDVSPVTTPVTTTVDQVVTGVVDGVTGLLDGLTGGGSTSGP
jgi:hypothetical protein